LTRLPPSAALAPFVDFYWIVGWDLHGRAPHEQTILPHPNVNLGFEASGAGIYGVDRKLFVRRLSGRGHALGVRFRSGCFRPFWRAPVSQLTDRVVPAVFLFGSAAETTRQAIMAASDSGVLMASLAEGLLMTMLPERDPVAEQAAELVAMIHADPSLRRVDQLAGMCGVSVRRVQRMFGEYVGVSPKWVMCRARLHEAAERADSGEHVDWAQLAADLGYADQAHLTQDFTATLGLPPVRYVGSLAGLVGGWGLAWRVGLGLAGGAWTGGRDLLAVGGDGAEVQRRAVAGTF
jgi:AraC-like DNA-binding protein